MKRKGFTLIELLAVIVVLAIIALIATPIVMNVIKNAQMGAAERTADNYLKAVETLIATEKLDGTPVADGEYEIDANGNLTFGDVEVSGTKPNGGTIVVENGQVVKDESSIEVGDYTVTFEDGKATAGEGKKLMTLADCDFLEDDAHNESRNPNTVGAKYSCNLGKETRNFYVLEAGTSSKAATLILEGNYDRTTLPYCDQDGENPFNALLCQGDGLTAKLDDIVENSWTKLDRSQIGIPSASQIGVADGREEDAYLIKQRLRQLWLYSYPAYEEWSEGLGAPYGYVTSTPDADNSRVVLYVDYAGYVYGSTVDAEYNHGVRPVITLSI